MMVFGVSWCLQDLQFVVAESDDLIGLEEMSCLGEVPFQGYTHDILELIAQVVDEVLIFCGNLRSQSVSLEDGIDAEIMVEVPVRTEQALRFQSFFFDVLCDGRALLFVVCATVDDDTLLGIIAHHVGVFLQQIKFESFNNHNGR